MVLTIQERLKDMRLSDGMIELLKSGILENELIYKNGEILEKEIIDTVGLSESGITQRYWISI